VFTGIIEATAKVLSNDSGSLEIECPTAFTDLRVGSSISVAGVCLTIKKLNKKCIQFDVIAETLSKTTLRSYKEGDRVNLERAMKADGRLDGHIVQGHIEATAEVIRIKNEKLKMKNEVLLRVKVPSVLLSNIVPKGSITFDGVSLTVASIDGDCISVALIPHTLENTTLEGLEKGDRVNIETDILARHAQKLKA
jgi:riboflavin synthase